MTTAVWILFGAMFAEGGVSGDAVIRAGAGASEIVIRTTSRLAGAIDSLTWNGKEFIDSHDHGRQLQSAASFDCARQGEFWPERFNPTEAGSRDDGAGERTTSELLLLEANGRELRTRTQMAFWLAPGEKSFGRSALNETLLSNHIHEKRVHIGHGTMDDVIEYDVTFTVPDGESHHLAQFEALTGYMPEEFCRFWRLAPGSWEREEMDEGPAEQNGPVILSTEDGSHAMGVFSPDQPSKGFEGVGYGRFRFKEEKVTKWNCVFRVREPRGIMPGAYRFRIFVAVGTMDNVTTALATLAKERDE